MDIAPMKGERPLVSCLMVTANRKKLVRRSVQCFKNQTYPHKELVIIDDGNQDLSDVLNMLPAEEFHYVKIKSCKNNTLGRLRNISLQMATGTFITQWDDDDWYHPQRISCQVQKLLEGYDACCLSTTLMHLNEEPYLYNPYLGTLPQGVPGSIMHRADASITYPPKRKAEDTEYLRKWMRKKSYCQLSEKYAYLQIRCFHGDNTWDKTHFLRRLRNNTFDALKYIWYKKLKGRLFEHPKFQLCEDGKESFRLYINDSKQLGLLN